MNNKLKTRYKHILENKIQENKTQINEMRAGAGGWWERLKFLFPYFRYFKSPKYMFEYMHRARMGGVINRYIMKFGRGTSKALDNVLLELNHNYGNTIGEIKSIIIQDDGAHILVVGTPPQYYYISPEGSPMHLPNFDPFNDTVPGHIPWSLPDGSANPDYSSPFQGPLPGGGAGSPTGGPGDNPSPALLPGLGGGGVLLFGDEGYSNPYTSPSNLPGWHPPMLPPIQPPAPPWLSPMDPNQPNFGIPGY